MPDSDYTTTPPTASAVQLAAISDKISDICNNVDKLSTKMEDIPLKLDRLATSVENLGRENEKTRNDLERTQHTLEQNIEKFKAEIDDREKALSETLKPLIASKTTIDTLTGWLKVGGVALGVAIYTGWTTMSARMEALTLQGQSTGQKVATLDEVVREGKAARLAATARIELLEKQSAQTRANK